MRGVVGYGFFEVLGCFLLFMWMDGFVVQRIFFVMGVGLLRIGVWVVYGVRILLRGSGLCCSYYRLIYLFGWFFQSRWEWFLFWWNLCIVIVFDRQSELFGSFVLIYLSVVGVGDDVVVCFGVFGVGQFSFLFQENCE